MSVVEATAEQVAAMRRDASDFQAYALGPCAMAVLRRYAFWHALTQTGAGVDIAMALDVPVDENTAADETARKFAAAVQGLNNGALELAHWTEGERSPLRLGIVRAGSIPSSLQLWPLVPVIVIGGALYGAWVVVNAWLSVRSLEAQSDALRAKTQASVTAAVTGLASQDPRAAAMLADALERANNAAANVQPSLLDKLSRAVSSAGDSLLDSSGLLLLLGAAWLWSRRRAA